MSNRTDRPPPDPTLYFGQPIVPVATVTIVLTTLFVGMRFWARVVILRAVAKWEDGLMLLAWVFAVGLSITNYIALEYGLGRQYAVLDAETRTNNLKLGLATNVIYGTALFTIKMSVLCLYIRVLTYDYVRLAAKIMLGIVAVSHTWIIVSILTGCIPLDRLWNKTKDANTYCHPGSVYWSHSGLNIGTDFLTALLPLAVLHKLHVPRRQKIALYCVFLLAFSACIISLLRTLQFLSLRFIDVSNDTTKMPVKIAIWTMCEVHIAVIAACIPTIKPVFTRFFPRLLGSDGGTGESSPWEEEMEQARARQRRPVGEMGDDDTVDGDLARLGYKGSAQSSMGRSTAPFNT